jgi:AAA15 family ATPase/GTPase
MRRQKMLIDFTVENYRSIKEPVTLSAVASRRQQPLVKNDSPTDSDRRRHVIPDAEIAPPFSVPGRDFDLLPVLGIFGANASGKSNVLRALDRGQTNRVMGAGS